MEILKFYEGGYNPEKEYVLYKSFFILSFL